MAALRKVEDPKRCRECNVIKPRTEYYRISTTKQGVASYCKPCANKKAKEARKRNPERARQASKRHEIKWRYGITLDEFRQMVDEQGGGCAICGTTKSRGEERLHVDHCHATGVVRGALCSRCNTGLGWFKENTGHLRRAAEYLEEASARTG